MSRSQRRPPRGPLPDYEYRELRDMIVAEWMEEEEMDQAYIIVQAWTPRDSEYELTEIYGRTGPWFFGSIESAKRELDAIAAEYDMELESEEMTFDIPDTNHQDEYFYIETLWRSE